MPWTKLDDQFYANRKIRRVWMRGGRALGLHVMAMTYSSRHLFDGYVDPEWVEEQLPNPRERAQVIQCLIDEKLWKPYGDGWTIHDFLKFNPSASHVEHVREMRRLNGKRGGAARWQPAERNGSRDA